jgi:hypothetical protein
MLHIFRGVWQTAKEQRKLPTRFQIGTVVESPFDGPGGRLTNAERESSIAMSLLHDESFKCVGNLAVVRVSLPPVFFSHFTFDVCREYGQKYVKSVSEAKGAASKKAYKKRGAARRRGHRR